MDTLRPTTRRLLLFAFWTALGLFFSLQSALSYLSRGDEVRWAGTLIFQMSSWYAWGLLAPLVLLVARRYPLARKTWEAGLLRLLPIGLGVAVLHGVLAVVMRFGGLLLFQVVAWPQVAEMAKTAWHPILIGSFDAFMYYWVIVGLYYTVAYYQKYRARQLEATRLEAQLVQAQLQNLKTQLHPHFLFNTLNSISALVTEQPEAAERMIARLSELLRLTLENTQAQEVTLQQELAFLERYLEIEKIRFQDRLTVSLDIAPDTLQAQVPNLVLQPLVENAIRHGIAPLPAAGHIAITAVRQKGALRLTVADNGPGVPNPAQVEEGVGLGNTRARLTQLYGSQQDLALEPGTAGGLQVAVTLPFREAPAVSEVAL